MKEGYYASGISDKFWNLRSENVTVRHLGLNPDTLEIVAYRKTKKKMVTHRMVVDAKKVASKLPTEVIIAELARRIDNK